MIKLENKRKSLKYLLGSYPNVWQLPNSIKIHEFLELTKNFKPQKNTRVLDLGCGKGLQTQLLALNGAEVIGVDPSEKRIGLAERELKWSKVKKNVKFFCGTLEDAKIESESIDYVISFCVLEHIPNLTEVLAELHRILKKDGEIHATVDALDNIENDDIKNRHRKEHAVVEYFTLETIEETLLKAGFEIFEKRHILTSDMAKEKLINEIETGNYLQTLEERKSSLAKLTEEEEKTKSRKQGTMILIRAKKITG